MKTNLFLSLLFCFGLISVQAQNPNPDAIKDPEVRERVEAYRVGFITEKLNLSVKESENFWPLYNKQREEMNALKESPSNRFKDLKNMSDEEVDAAILAKLDSGEKLLEARRRHYQEMKQVLPVKKIARLYKAERAFHRELLGKIKETRGEGNGPPNRNRGNRK